MSSTTIIGKPPVASWRAVPPNAPRSSADTAPLFNTNGSSTPNLANDVRRVEVPDKPSCPLKRAISFLRNLFH